MTLTQIVPVLALAAFVLTMLSTLRSAGAKRHDTWRIPAVLSGLFAIWSLYTVATEGLMQFWINHSTNLSGTQVWIDLLLALGIGWTLMLPKARRFGMMLPFWLVFLLTTGCVGLLAMMSRLMWLEENSAPDRA